MSSLCKRAGIGSMERVGQLLEARVGRACWRPPACAVCGADIGDERGGAERRSFSSLAPQCRAWPSRDLGAPGLHRRRCRPARRTRTARRRRRHHRRGPGWCARGHPRGSSVRRARRIRSNPPSKKSPGQRLARKGDMKTAARASTAKGLVRGRKGGDQLHKRYSCVGNDTVDIVAQSSC